MKLIIHGKQLKLSPALKAYVDKHLVRPLTRFYDNAAAELEVEFGDTNGPKGGLDKECHLTLRMPGAKTLHVEETTADAYASLDQAGERLMRICKRELERMRKAGAHRVVHPLQAEARRAR